MTSVETYPSAIAKARFVRISPTKARRVIDLVRGKSVTEALDILRWAPQDASEPVAKVIASAAANAQNNEGLDPSTLVVATVYADEGPTAKRIRPRAQGRAFRIRKRTSHITVIVESRPPRGERGPASRRRPHRARVVLRAARPPPRRRHRRPRRHRRRRRLKRPPLRRLRPRRPQPRRHRPRRPPRRLRSFREAKEGSE